MAVVEWLHGLIVTLGDIDEEYVIECPVCRLRYLPTTHDGHVKLRPGRMYAVRCPRCGCGVYLNQLQEGIAADDE